MKNITFAMIVMVNTANLFAQSSLFLQNPLSQGNSLNGVSFTDANNGTAVGDYGTILRSTNGGATWTSQSSGTTRSLNGVSFTDANNGTAVGDYGKILRTTNGGATWTSQSSGIGNWLHGVSFTDANNGTAVGANGWILRTTNGGATWTSPLPSAFVNRHGVSFTDANNGTVVGANGTILRTTNGGTSWTSQSSGTTNILYGVSFTDANTGTVVGVGGTIVRTTNGGATWTSQLSGTTNSLNGVSFTDANTGTAVGGSGTILRTTNGGATWTSQSSGTTQSLNGVSFTDADNGTAVGISGTILYTTNGGTSWNKEISTVSTPTFSPSPGTYTSAQDVSISCSTSSATIYYTTNGTEPTESSPVYSSSVHIASTTTLKARAYKSGWNPSVIASGVYEITCTVSTSSSPADGGTTTGGGTYNSGQIVTVTATPNSGYSFVNWTENGTSVSTNPSYQFTINSNRNLVANFSVIPSLSVTPAFIEVNSLAGTGAFTVSNTTGGTMSWRAVSNASWIIIPDDTTGINSGTININYQANAGEARIGTITITAPGAIGSPITVEVKQAIYTSVDELGSGKPVSFKLLQNYPNPFNPTTAIEFQLPSSSFVIMKVFNSAGKEVATLVERQYAAGIFRAEWNASDMPSGIYYCRIQAGKYSETKKMVLMR